MGNLILGKEYFDVKGACLEVYNQLGCGFLEKVYQDALAIEFGLRGIPFVREKHITIGYKGHIIDHDYYADFIRPVRLKIPSSNHAVADFLLCDPISKFSVSHCCCNYGKCTTPFS